MRHFAFALALAALTGGAFAQDAELTTISSKFRDQIVKSRKKVIAILDLSNRQGYNDDFSQYVADELSVRLVQDSPGFRVVTRSRLNQILQELGLRNAREFDPVTFKKVGQLSGADAVIAGSFQVLPSSVRIVLQLLDVTDGAILTGVIGSLQRTKDLEAFLVENKAEATAASPGEAPARKPAVAAPLQQAEQHGLSFHLHECTVTPTAATCKMSFLSPGVDRNVGMESVGYMDRHSSLFDQAGREHRAVRTLIGSSAGQNSASLLVRDVPVPAEVSFQLNTDVTFIPLIRLYINDAAQGDFMLEFRNIKPKRAVTPQRKP